MKIKEVIEKLEKFNPDLEVYLSVDSEGNGFGTLEESCFEETFSGKGLIIFHFGEGLNYEDL